MSVNTAGIAPAILLMAEDNSIQTSYNVEIYGGLAAAAVSPENIEAGNVRIQQINDTDGHIKDIRVTYKQRGIKADNTTERNCDVGPTIPYLEQVYPANQYVGRAVSMDENQVREFISATTELERLAGVTNPGQIVQVANGLGAAQSPLSVAREIYKDLIYEANAMIQGIDETMIASVVAGKGIWKGGATGTFVVQAADGSLAPAGLNQFKQLIRTSGFRGEPFVIGGAGAYQRIFMNDDRYFGQAANGINYSTARATQVPRFYYSENIADALTDEDSALVIMPGQVFLLPYLRYKGNFGKIGNMFRFTMPMPGLPGLQIDCRILPDECNENFAIWMELNFDTFVAPLDLFQTGDKLDGVNGVYAAQFTQAS